MVQFFSYQRRVWSTDSAMAFRAFNKVSPPQSSRSASNMRSEGDAAMDSAIIDEILEELSSALQRVEAQSTAILELIKEEGIAKEDELAPYLRRANEASSVRWRATRVRIGHLLSGLEKREQQAKDEGKGKEEHKEKTPQSASDEASEPKKTAKREDAEQPTEQPVAHKQDEGETPRPVQSRKADVSDAPGSHEPSPKQQESSKTGSSKTAQESPEKADQSNAA
jgi:hypothetical protein